MLQAVVDHGGYAGAAEALSKSVSTVNYGIRRLEAGLGVELLELEGRRAVLTRAGRELLRRSRHLLDEAMALERAAGALARGWEAVVTLAVEVIFPQERLLRSLDAFARLTGTTRVELIESVLSGTTEQLFSGVADLAITAWVPPGFLGDPLVTVEFVAVAHPDHPLHQLGRPLTQRDLRQHRQLVVRDSGLRESRDAGWLEAEQRWTVDHMNTAKGIVEAGFAYAWLPECLIRESLNRGRLVTLDLEAGAIQMVPFSLAFADRDHGGIAAETLAETLRAAFAVPVPEPHEVPDWWSMARCGSRANL